ncbi:hypothetical protein ABPG75_011395 [Micractinium tetrahymenae]
MAKPAQGSGEAIEGSLLDLLDDGTCLAILRGVPAECRPALRLVCRRFQALVDSALCPSFYLDDAAHLAGRRPRGAAIYASRSDFLAAAARVLQQRAGGLDTLLLDFDAYGCIAASHLLEQQPLPRLRSIELRNAEAQHVAALRALRLPRLCRVALTRHINGPVTAGPAAELLVAQLAGLPLRRLRLGGYRMLPGVVASVADALPHLSELTLEVERVEQHGRLELAALPRLARLERFTLRLLNGPASAGSVTVAPLPATASSLWQLSSLSLGHVRPGEGEEDAFWGSLAALPLLQHLEYAESSRAVWEPPEALLRLGTLTSLCIKIEGSLDGDASPLSTWSQLPELPEGALPALASLRVDSVGLLAFPASWCRLPLQELHISGCASPRCWHYTLELPEELGALAPTLRRLELLSCGLRDLPDQLASLTGLTYLGLQHNRVACLPALRRLQRLQAVDLWDNPVASAAQALQGCSALRRLVLGTAGLPRRRVAGGAAYEDEEAWRWEDAWLDSIRGQLPWVQAVGPPTADSTAEVHG